jgi:hypothetical protein
MRWFSVFLPIYANGAAVNWSTNFGEDKEEVSRPIVYRRASSNGYSQAHETTGITSLLESPEMEQQKFVVFLLARKQGTGQQQPPKEILGLPEFVLPGSRSI